MSKRVAFDVGGTFTDFVVTDEETGASEVFKYPSTPDDPSTGVLEGLNQFLEREGIPWTEVTQLIHATTVATNTVLERKGAETALVVTDGFRDVPIIGRQKRYDIYDLFLEKPDPIVDREDIYEVDERVHPRFGTVDEPDEAALAELAGELAADYDSVAVSLLHSYHDAAHEEVVAEALEAADPELAVTRASALSKRFREYERTNTAAVDAYLKPRVRGYIDRLLEAFAENGYQDPFFMMKSSGGVMTADRVHEAPVQIVESGPVAGALHSQHLGDHLGLDNLFSFDMGGTTAKICFIVDGEPKRTSTFEIDKLRLKEGSGLPINLEVIDMVEISAGGGSIADVGETGTVSVGPESAGADPGPICYGQGGDRPTVTDADLVLGYLNPDLSLAGEMSIDREAAACGIREHVGDPLGMDSTEAAAGIKEVIDNSMMQASRIHAAERGLDPRKFGMIAFGGAGPMHAPFIARRLNIPKVIVPRGAGVASAKGLLVPDITFHLEQTQTLSLEPDTVDTINEIYAGLEEEGRDRLEVVRGGSGEVSVSRSADMKYEGQYHEINSEVPAGKLDREAVAEIEERFHAAYGDTYGYSDPDDPITAVTWKVTVSKPTVTPPLERIERETSLEAAAKGTREAYFDRANGYTEVRVFDRAQLPVGAELDGPVVVEETNATTVVPPEDTMTVDKHGNLLIDLD
jgi:N-methylhydantoinase A